MPPASLADGGVVDELLAPMRRAGIAVPSADVLRPLAPTLEYWLSPGQHHQAALLPATGGILLSARIEAGVLGPLRVDTEPVWEPRDPAAVYRVAADLALSTGQPAVTPLLHSVLNWSAWTAPGGGAVPFLGVTQGNDGAAAVRCWAPTVWMPTPLTDWHDAGWNMQLPHLPENSRTVMGGVHVANSRMVKLTTYVPGPTATSSRDLLAAIDATAADFGGHAAVRLIDQAIRAERTAYRGWAYRTKNGSGWQAVLEVEVTRCDPAVLPRWASQVHGNTAARALERLINDGLHPCIVTLGRVHDGPGFSAVYFSPTAPLPTDVMRVAELPEVTGPFHQSRPGAIAQTVVAADGSATTASWTKNA